MIGEWKENRESGGECLEGLLSDASRLLRVVFTEILPRIASFSSICIWNKVFHFLSSTGPRVLNNVGKRLGHNVCTCKCSVRTSDEKHIVESWFPALHHNIVIIKVQKSK